MLAAAATRAGYENPVEVLASLFYVENWALGLAGSDYFGGGATAVQHYWSLSVEEQFYALWPALIAVVWVWRVRRGSAGPRRALLVAVLALGVVSYALSIWTTGANPDLAFFGTHTRVWEFCVGAALALLPAWTAPRAIRAAASWLALGVLLAVTLIFSARTPFPGWIAAIPVLAAAVVIAAGAPDVRWAPPFRLRPVQWVGDISYSLYLWHWPPIVLLPLIFGEAWSQVWLVPVFVACFPLAWATKVLVEDRFRAPRAQGQSNAQAGDPEPRVRRPGAVIAAMVAVVAVVAAIPIAVVTVRGNDAQRALDAAVAAGEPCLGAAALGDPDCDAPLGDVIVPDPGVAQRSFFESSYYTDCLVEPDSSDILSCRFGDPGSDTHIALVGDSHAVMWLPAIEQVALAEGWKVTTYMRASCPVSLAVTILGGSERQLCAEWSDAVVRTVSADSSIDLVVTAAKNNKRWDGGTGPDGHDAAVAGYVDTWTQFVDSGKRVLAIGDAPRTRADVVDCLASEPVQRCAVPRDVATTPERGPADPQATAVGSMATTDVRLVDPTEQICGPDACGAVVGSIAVFVDEGHLSTHYSRTLSPLLREELATML